VFGVALGHPLMRLHEYIPRFFEDLALAIFSKLDSSTTWYKMYKVALSFTHASFSTFNYAFDQFVVLAGLSKPSSTTSQFSWELRAFILRFQLS